MELLNNVMIESRSVVITPNDNTNKFVKNDTNRIVYIGTKWTTSKSYPK